jgi:hypothetical protein
MIGPGYRSPKLAGLLTLLVGYSSVSLGDSAQVLPKGRSGVLTSYYDYFTIDERYDSDGNREDLAADFNTSLDSSVFAGLQVVEGGFGMAAGSASFGDTVVQMEYDIKIFELEFYYGITDKFTAGVKIPYWWVESKVNASVNSGSDSSATVGFNPFWGTGGNPYPSPVIPLGAPGAQPATDEDIQAILGPGLDINGVPAVEGFGYQQFETWKGEGLSDVEFSGRYQYLKTEKWRHAFTAGFRVPTGRIDDPDNLADMPFGLGAYQVLLRSNHDVAVSDKVTLNLSLKYDIVGSDSQEKRVPTDVNQPITSNKVMVDIDYGNVFEFDTTATYRFTPQWSTFGRYRFTHKKSNEVSGPPGLDVDSLEAETNREGQQFQVGVAYSTVSRYFDGMSKVPYRLALSYRDRFAGKNLLDSQYLKLEGQLFF